MTWKNYLLVVGVSLPVILAFSVFQSAPGYMDAEYYYTMGLRIAVNKVFSEPFIWNFLTGSTQIPHPGFTFWMPMPALISALSIFLTGLKTFQGAKLAFIVIASLIPAVTMKIAFELTNDKQTAILAGLLACFPVFYSSFLGTTDSFGFLMILGSFYFLGFQKNEKFTKYIGVGLIAGLINLTRADGLLWLLSGGIVVLLSSKQKIQSLVGLMLGFLVIMTPWYIRNWIVLGEIMPSGTTRMFWLTDYNDMFSYQPSFLTFTHWIQQGFPTIARNILNAGLMNLKTSLIVQGQIILVPLAAAGIRKYWREMGVKAMTLSWVMIFGVMTVVFPFAGSRGGFFHSGAALQPLIWVLAASGMHIFLIWGKNYRGWIKNQAELFLGGGLLVLLAWMTVFTLFNRVIGDDITQPKWNHSLEVSKEIGSKIEQMGFSDTDLVMINDPPGYFVAMGNSAVVIPDGGVDVLRKAALDFGVKIIALESNHPELLTELYLDPENESRLEFLGSENGVHFFSIPY